MGSIKVLDTQTANLIAAGEVVERPASVVKELMENSIDAGASRITVEIQNGGVTYIRVTDDGCGMSKEDAQNCIVRHATSKISTAEDLYGISTLGFRGEALAAISSVSRFRILTKQKQEQIGYAVEFTAEDGLKVSEAGCPDGTTMIATDLFYNVPARRKFLKKDFAEAMAVSSVVDKVSLSHPEISVKYICDNKPKYTTRGDGSVENAMYTVFGKDFYETQIPVDAGYSDTAVSVSGYICKPECGRSNRNMQYLFLNGRSIRSKTVSAALDEAYRTYMPDGNFPTCVLFLSLDYASVDVNVHPTKQEVKFTSEKQIFDAVYFAVKNTLSKLEQRPSLEFSASDSYASKSFEAAYSFVPLTTESETFAPQTEYKEINKNVFSFAAADEDKKEFANYNTVILENSDLPKENDAENKAELLASYQKPAYKIIGEAYNCYIFVELNDRILVVDKHAAHERILYNEIVKDRTDNCRQELLIPISVGLSKSELSALSEYLEDINAYGFDVEIFGTDSVLVRAVPLPLADGDISSIIISVANSLLENKGRVSIRSAVYERALFTAACKAAMKGGQHTNSLQNEYVVEKVLTDNAVRYCPHGRPVAYEIKKSSLENQFGR